MKHLPLHYKVASHTKNVTVGTTFVAIQGDQGNGIDYIKKAVENGSRAIVVDRNEALSEDIHTYLADHNVSLTHVNNTRKALAELSAQAYNYPAHKLKILGITGTKGKTTSVYLAHHLLLKAGYNVAMLTGVENKINNDSFSAELTTPQPDYLHMFFDQCVQEGIEYVVMEASAQAFSLHRLDGVLFDAVIFTNFSMEHAEFYPTIEEYFEAKCEIFDHCTPESIKAVNGDDMWAHKIIQGYKDLCVYGFSPAVSQKAILSFADMKGLSLKIQDHTYTSSSIVGPYNASNLLGVITVLNALGLSHKVLQKALESFRLVPGRLEQIVLPTGVRAIIDYAHNPSSFQALFSMLKTNTHHLSVVFGCGGGRDTTKRPMMGELASRYCDAIYLTTDNPRQEEPALIVEDILKGIPPVQKKNVVIEQDRAKAINRALENAPQDGIVAILGKGPDEYQLIGLTKTFFSDKQEIQKFI